MSIDSYYVKEVLKDGQLRYLLADKLTQSPIKAHWSFDYPDVAYAQLSCLDKDHQLWSHHPDYQGLICDRQMAYETLSEETKRFFDEHGNLGSLIFYVPKTWLYRRLGISSSDEWEVWEQHYDHEDGNHLYQEALNDEQIIFEILND